MLGLRASLEWVKVIMGLPFGACIWVLLLHFVAQCKVLICSIVYYSLSECSVVRADEASSNILQLHEAISQFARLEHETLFV